MTRAADGNTISVNEGNPTDGTRISMTRAPNGTWIPTWPDLSPGSGVSTTLEPWLQHRLNVPESESEARADDRIHVPDLGIRYPGFKGDVAVAEYRDDDSEWVVEILD